MTKQDKHWCEPGFENGKYIFKSDGFGAAIIYCGEIDDGILQCGNGEYETRVNYCPFCGYKAKSQVEYKPN